MPKLLRSAPLILLAISLAIPAVGYAQDDGETPVTIQGTLELEGLMIAIRDAYLEANPDLAVEIDPRGGLATGFEALCDGTVDLVMSTEPISDSQMAVCADNAQDFIETVLGYEVVVLLATPEAGLTCIPQTQVQDLWQLGAPEAPTWTDLGSEALDTEIQFIGPTDLTPTYLLFRSLVPAGDLREDIATEDDAAAIVEAIQTPESSALGFMSLADLNRLNTEGDLVPLDIQNADGACVPPTLSTLGNGTYLLARTDYLYVNAASAQRGDVQAFLQFTLQAEGGIKAIGAEAGYTVADEGTYEYGINNVLTAHVGRTFTRPVTPVTVSTADAGTLTIVGTNMLNDLVRPVRSDFTSQFPNAVVETNTLGNENGWDAFCKGEADVLQTTRAATDADRALCYANDVTYETVDLGVDALVVAVPASADWIECLTANQAAALLRAGTEEEPAATLWSDIDPDWPETEILLVRPPMSGGETDYLIYHLIGDLTLPVRMDGTENRDAGYRLVGTGNTDNAITWAWWSDYAAVEDANVKLLGVGDSCVVPSPDTLADETYPLAFPVAIHVSRASFPNAMVRAFLWHLYDDATLSRLEDSNFVGLDLTTMALAGRDAVFEMLAAYEAEAATQPADEPTPEASDGGTDNGSDSGDTQSGTTDGGGN